MKHNSTSGWFQAMRISFVLVTAIITAHIASEAAFPEMPARSLTDETSFFQTQETASETSPSAQSTQSEQSTASDSIRLAEPSAPTPTTGARALLVADLETGHIFAAKDENQTLPIASISKLMTAVIASETLSANETVTISEQAVATYGISGGLSAGDAITVDNLFYPLLLESSNDAAEALAEAENRAIFINQMNRKASALDMNETRFEDASGLSANNVSSASNLLTLSQYIFDTKPFIFDITTRRQSTTPSSEPAVLSVYTSVNPMTGRAQFIGGKNGYTDEARHTLLSLFSVEFPSGNRPIAIIVLGSETHVTDTMRLLEWIKSGV